MLTLTNVSESIQLIPTHHQVLSRSKMTLQISQATNEQTDRQTNRQTERHCYCIKPTLLGSSIKDVCKNIAKTDPPPLVRIRTYPLPPCKRPHTRHPSRKLYTATTTIIMMTVTMVALNSITSHVAVQTACISQQQQRPPPASRAHSDSSVVSSSHCCVVC